MLLAAAWDPEVVAAHGPCDCLGARVVQPGAQVRIVGSDGRQAGGTGYPAYRVVFNPRPADLGIAPAYLAGAYRADGPSATVLSRAPTDPTRRGRFRVPRDAPPGLYMVLIFDGEEGGAHNTWDYLHVTAGEAAPSGVVTAGRRSARPVRQPNTPSSAADTSAPEGSSVGWPVVVLAAVGGATLGLLGGRRLGRSGG